MYGLNMATPSGFILQELNMAKYQAIYGLVELGRSMGLIRV
jgi:hypothetical protein